MEMTLEDYLQLLDMEFDEEAHQELNIPKFEKRKFIGSGEDVSLEMIGNEWI